MVTRSPVKKAYSSSLRAAQAQPGSWWTGWSGWLHEHGTGQVRARPRPSLPPLQALTDALDAYLAWIEDNADAAQSLSDILEFSRNEKNRKADFSDHRLGIS